MDWKSKSPFVRRHHRQQTIPGNPNDSSSDSDDDEGFLFKIDSNVFTETQDQVRAREAALKKSRRTKARAHQNVDTLDAFAYVVTPDKTLTLQQAAREECKLWDCGVACADLLRAHPHLVRGKRVLELGCGVGLPGFVASTLGAMSVLLTDRAGDHLDLVRCNARANHLDDVYVRPLIWGEPVDGLEDVEVLLACDLIYAESSLRTVNALCSTIFEYIRPEIILFVYRERFHGSTVSFERFNDERLRNGFQDLEMDFSSVSTDPDVFCHAYVRTTSGHYTFRDA